MSYFRPKTIQELNANSVISEDRMLDLRKRAHVLVVDDVQGRLDENLRRSGFSNVSMMRDVERIQDVEPYQVVLVDVFMPATSGIVFDILKANDCSIPCQH